MVAPLARARTPTSLQRRGTDAAGGRPDRRAFPASRRWPGHRVEGHDIPGEGPAQEKDFFAKFLADRHPEIRTHVEGVEKADHPTDGELVDHARRFVKAADRMRPQR